MKQIRNAIFILIGIIVVSCSKSPDVIYYNGKIYTLNSKNAIVEAIAVKNGKIIDLGKNDEIKNKYNSNNSLDLQGKTVIPGFIDSDGSLVDFSMELSRFNNLIDLRNCSNVKQILKLVEDKIKSQNAGYWVGGYGWNENNITDADDINKSLLDKISNTLNIYLINSDGTIVWCNSKLLGTLNIDKDTKEPVNGEFDKDENGELSGLLFGSAVNLVNEKLPKFTKNDLLNSIETGANELLKYGITEIHDRSVNSESISAFRELIDSGKFPIRIFAVLTGNDKSFDEYFKKGIEINYKDRLTVRSVTIDYDGSVELQTASMRDDYKTEPKKTNPYCDEPTIENILRKALDKNFQFTIKTVGDKAVNNTLNIIEKISKEKKLDNPRIKFDGIEFVQSSDINRLKEFKIIPSIKPEACLYDIDVIPLKIPISNLKNFALWNTLLQNCGMITTSSGFPFSHSINPFVQIYYLTNRQFLDTLRNDIPSDNQKLSILDALKSYTIWPAYSGFEEDIKGSLEKGKFADMIVISDDIFNIDSKKLPNIKVLKTIIDGKLCYEYKE